MKRENSELARSIKKLQVASFKAWEEAIKLALDANETRRRAEGADKAFDDAITWVLAGKSDRALESLMTAAVFEGGLGGFAREAIVQVYEARIAEAERGDLAPDLEMRRLNFLAAKKSYLGSLRQKLEAIRRKSSEAWKETIDLIGKTDCEFCRCETQQLFALSDVFFRDALAYMDDELNTEMAIEKLSRATQERARELWGLEPTRIRCESEIRAEELYNEAVRLFEEFRKCISET